VNTEESSNEGDAPVVQHPRRPWRKLLAIAVLVAVAWGFVRTRAYVTRDTRSCIGACHAPKDPAVGWHAKGHKDLTCTACHTTASGTGYRLLWTRLTSGKTPVKHGKVDAATCKACHEKLVNWPEVSATEGHKGHRAVKDTDCLSCHSEFAHKLDRPTERTCLKCHDSLRLHGKASAPETETCMSCHGFAYTPRENRKSIATVCRACHADDKSMKGATTAKTPESMTVFGDKTVHGGLNCKLCHDPHGKKKAPGSEGRDFCVRCHQLDLLSFPGDKDGPEAHRKCDGCHVPHAARDQVLTLCSKCHEKITKPAGAEKPTALAHKSCASCHRPHLWKPPLNGCVPCHEQQAHLVQMRSPPQHGTCTSCHQAHGPKPTGAVCIDCHSKTKKNHVALAPEKHRDCTTCHSPHTPAPSEAKTACAQCHKTQLSDVVRGPVGHSKQGCFGCHSSHDSPKAKAEVCATCHGPVAKSVAAAPTAEHRACTSCHAPHRFSIENGKDTCLACHGAEPAGKGRKAASGVAAVVIDPAGTHKGNCKDCHARHGSPAVPKTACFTCHAQVQAQFTAINPTHGACASCHLPHKPAGGAIARCAGCHEPQATAASKWPTKSAHAGPCSGCHQQHDAKVVKSCADCHDKQSKSATGSKHQCAQCHAPHKAPPGTGTAWWGKCESCHSAQTLAVKDRGFKHSDCKSCHAPHRFAAPTCSSCHDMSKRGLHSGKQHSKCGDCHETHAKSAFTRAQCLKCHEDKRDHQPAAKVCQGCHVFK
jgi:hypothetical protein